MKHRSDIPPFKPNLITCAMASMVMAAGLMLHPASWARGVTVSGNTATTVGTRSDGATVIQGATPNATGTSYNTYLRFNADNARGTWMDNTSLGVRNFINEVTGTEASVLSAGLGVLGQRAGLVLINPNGITVNGNVAFSNVSQANLVVGRTKSGDIDTLSTSLAKQGASLNVNRALSNPDGALALLSPKVSVASGGSVKAAGDAELLVSAGQASFDSRSARLLSVDASSSNNLAVDASLLGAMNAGVIRVITTRQGAGVNTGGTWAAQQGINVQASAGAISASNTHFSAGGSDGTSLNAATALKLVQVKATGALSASGSTASLSGVSGQSDVNVASKGALQSTGVVSAGRDLTLSSDQSIALSSQMQATRQLKLQSGGNISYGNYAGKGDVSLDATGQVTSTGGTLSGSNLALRGGRGVVLSGGVLRAAQDVSVTSDAGVTMNGHTVDAGRDLKIRGAGNVDLGVTSSSYSVVDPVVSNNYSNLNISGSVGFGFFRPAGITISGSANLGASYSSGKTSSTTQTVTRLMAKQDVMVTSGGTTTLKGTVVEAGRDASVDGVSAVQLLAAHDTYLQNRLALSISGGGSASGRIPFIFGTGNVTINGTVNGSANAAQASTTTAKAVSISAGRDAQVLSAQGNILGEGSNIKATSGQAKVNAAGDIVLGAATSNNTLFTETAALSGTLNVPVQVDSGLRILGGLLFRGTSLLDSVRLQSVNVGGGANGVIKGDIITKQSGGSVTGGQGVALESGKMMKTAGALLKAPRVTVSGKDGVLLGSAVNSAIKVNVNGGGTLGQQNIQSGRININVAGALDGNVSIQGAGTQVQGTDIQVSSSQGVTELQGARIDGNQVVIDGAKAVNVGTSLDITGQVTASFQGPLDIGIDGLALNIGTPSLILGGGQLGLSLPKVDLTAQALFNLAVAGTAKGSMSIGGVGSQVNSKGDTVISSSQGDVKLTGSQINSQGSTKLQAARSVQMASALRLTGQLDGQFNVGAKGLLNLAASIQNTTITLKPGTLRLQGIGIAAGLDLGLGGLSLAGTSLPELGVSLGLSGTGSATLGSDASGINAGRDVLMSTQGSIELSKPNIQAGGNVQIEGGSISVKAPVDTTVRGNLSAALPVQILPTLNLDLSKLNLNLGGGIALKEVGGKISGQESVVMKATTDAVKMTGTYVTSKNKILVQAAREVTLKSATSLYNGVLTDVTPTQLIAPSVTVSSNQAGEVFLKSATSLNIGVLNDVAPSQLIAPSLTVSSNQP
jgi:filamentous hemagglutinin